MTEDKNIKQFIEEVIGECERLKMENIEVFHVEKWSSLCKYIIIANAEHPTVIDSAYHSLKRIGKNCHQTLGNKNEDYQTGWLVMDYFDVVIHIFLPEVRSFYALDEWVKSCEKEYEINGKMQ